MQVQPQMYMMQPVPQGDGHVIPAAPIREALPTPPPRVFSLVSGNGGANGAIAKGTFLINGISARILFDSGALHSFVDVSFAKAINLKYGWLIPPMSVSTPLVMSIDLDLVCRDCEVTFDGGDLTFGADLIILKMREFDAILGMDWLAKYHAIINCFYKTISILLPDGV